MGSLFAERIGKEKKILNFIFSILNLYAECTILRTVCSFTLPWIYMRIQICSCAMCNVVVKYTLYSNASSQMSPCIGVSVQIQIFSAIQTHIIFIIFTLQNQTNWYYTWRLQQGQYTYSWNPCLNCVSSAAFINYNFTFLQRVV